MFIALFSLMFAVFNFVQATSSTQDKDKALEKARKMFILMETPSKIDSMADKEESAKKINYKTFEGKLSSATFGFATQPAPSSGSSKALI
jgi:hypothetical protein